MNMNISNYYRSLSAFMLLGPLCFGQYHFEVKDASKNYVAIITIDNCFDDQCMDKGTIELFDNKNSKVQTFTSDNLVMYLGKGQRLERGKVIPLTKEQTPLVFGDFNFDGTEDLAIRNGNMGNYSSASYDVYVFNSTRMSFVKSAELTELGSNNFDFFETDPVRKRIITFGKDGCCRLFTTEYEVIPNKGIDRVLDKEEDLTNEDYVKVTIKEKKKNKWITKTKVYPSDQYNKEK